MPIPYAYGLPIADDVKGERKTKGYIDSDVDILKEMGIMDNNKNYKPEFRTSNEEVRDLLVWMKVSGEPPYPPLLIKKLCNDYKKLKDSVNAKDTAGKPRTGQLRTMKKIEAILELGGVTDFDTCVPSRDFVSPQDPPPSAQPCIPSTVAPTPQPCPGTQGSGGCVVHCNNNTAEIIAALERIISGSSTPQPQPDVTEAIQQILRDLTALESVISEMNAMNSDQVDHGPAIQEIKDQLTRLSAEHSSLIAPIQELVTLVKGAMTAEHAAIMEKLGRLESSLGTNADGQTVQNKLNSITALLQRESASGVAAPPVSGGPPTDATGGAPTDAAGGAPTDATGGAAADATRGAAADATSGARDDGGDEENNAASSLTLNTPRENANNLHSSRISTNNFFRLSPVTPAETDAPVMQLDNTLPQSPSSNNGTRNNRSAFSVDPSPPPSPVANARNEAVVQPPYLPPSPVSTNAGSNNQSDIQSPPPSPVAQPHILPPSPVSSDTPSPPPSPVANVGNAAVVQPTSASLVNPYNATRPNNLRPTVAGPEEVAYHQNLWNAEHSPELWGEYQPPAVDSTGTAATGTDTATSTVPPIVSPGWHPEANAQVSGAGGGDPLANFVRNYGRKHSPERLRRGQPASHTPPPDPGQTVVAKVLRKKSNSRLATGGPSRTRQSKGKKALATDANDEDTEATAVPVVAAAAAVPVAAAAAAALPVAAAAAVPVAAVPVAAGAGSGNATITRTQSASTRPIRNTRPPQRYGSNGSPGLQALRSKTGRVSTAVKNIGTKSGKKKKGRKTRKIRR